MTTPVKPFQSSQPRLLQRLKEGLVRKTPEKPKELKQVLKELAESSSLHGVPKLVSSPQIAVKILWSLLFLGTFGVLSLQIYTLLSNYLANPVDTSVALNFHQLRFPAITLCNMNPVLDSLMDDKYFALNIKKPTTKRKKRDTKRRKNKSTDKEDTRRNILDIARKRDKFDGGGDAKTAVNIAPDGAVREDGDATIDASTINPTPVQAPDQPDRPDDDGDTTTRSSESMNKAEFIHNLEILEKRLLYRKPRAVSATTSSGAAPTFNPPPSGTNPATSPPTSNNSPPPSGTNSQPPPTSNSQPPSGTNSQPPPTSNSQPPSGTNSQSSPSYNPPTSLHTSFSTSSYPYHYSSSSSSSVPYWSESGWWWNYWSTTDSWDSSSYASSSYYDNGMDIQEIFSGERDKWEEKRKMFQYMFKKMPVDNRTSIGHPIKEMVLSMTFLGFEKNVSNFKQLATSEYGNCYTLDSDVFKAWRSGPSNGISITMNLMRDEYVSKFASGYGVRIVFHESGTFPLPATEGITLSPGTDNNIAMKMVHLSRLGKPYGDCSEGKDFERTFGYKYSSSACLQMCRTNVVISECQCLPFDAPEIMPAWYSTVEVCQTKNKSVEICILDKADGQLASGKIKCDCPLPCRETVYEKTISWREWPNQDYMQDVLIEKMCDKNITSTQHITNQPDKTGCNDTSTEWRCVFNFDNTCSRQDVLIEKMCDKNITSTQHITNQPDKTGCNDTSTEWRCVFNYDICNDNATLDKAEWQKNFLRVQVYFEDLNFEDITEKPAYEFVRFISDIGGAMGLFMGASILSLVEFLQVTLEIGIWAYEKHKRGRQANNAKINVAPAGINTISK